MIPESRRLFGPDSCARESLAAMTLASQPEPGTGRPVGLPVNAFPAARPGVARLEGRFGRIEKLDAGHAADLWAGVRGQDALWSYMPYGPFTDERAFNAWIAERAALEDPFAYAIVDGESGRALGIFTLMEIRPAMRVIEVGHVLYTPALQRTPLATEAQYTLARYAFETLGYRRYEWKCNALNAPSRSAAERYGFSYEGLFRQHVIVKGRNRDTAWYAMLDQDWPKIRTGFERWLEPGNFDADGNQKRSLQALRDA